METTDANTPAHDPQCDVAYVCNCGAMILGILRFPVSAQVRKTLGDNQGMKLLLGILFVAIIAGSIYADYRWKQWMAKQREARERNDPNLRS